MAARPPRPSDPPRLLGLRVLAWRSRHLLRGVVAVMLVLAVARVLAPAPAPTTPVVVTARDVAVGATLTADDLRVVHVPDRLVPAGAQREVSSLAGRVPLVPLAELSVVLDGVLAGERFGMEPPPGSVVVPLVLTSAGFDGVVRVGDRVDVVTVADDGEASSRPEVLARRALVVDVPEPEERGGPAAAVGLGETPAAAVMVAVRPDEGRRLAATAGWSVLGAVLVP